MDFGMFVDFHMRNGKSQVDAFEEGFKHVKMGEKLGIDTIWLAEDHFSPDHSVLASPIIVASAVAVRTQRARIGLAVQVLPLSNPLRIAEEAATLDHISKGRLDFGVGRSGLTQYYRGYNIPYSESRSRFFEALEIILKAWQQEQFSHQGEFYSFKDVTVVPKSYQKPRPPIRVAVEAAESFTLLGSMGHPIFIHANTPNPLVQLPERLQLYRKARQEAKHSDPESVTLRIPTYVAETAEKARSEPEASTMQEIQYGIRSMLATAASPETAQRIERLANLTYDEILQNRVMYGTPEAVVERLQEYKEKLGISSIVVEMNFGGQIPFERVVNSMRLFLEKIVPKFK